MKPIKAYKNYLEEEKKIPSTEYKEEDIVVEKLTYKEEVKENGAFEKKPITKKVNLTKKINETAKIFKQELAMQKIKEIEEIYTK